MSIAAMLLPEFDMEMANTRKVLAVVPDDKFDWQAKPGMHTIGWVVSHLVEIPDWIPGTISQSVWDLSPPGGEPYVTTTVKSRAEALQLFDKGVKEARKALEGAADSLLAEPFTLANGGQAYFTMPKLGVIRTWVLNHSIHHRAFLISYLRQNDVEVPAMYG
jgi:uncharacterized damage-inducible protein DinB